MNDMSLQLCLSPLIQSIAMGLLKKTIVFSKTKDGATKIWALLSRHCPETVVLHHASLTSKRCHEVEGAFKSGLVKVIVATIGFGMVRTYVY